MQNFRTSVRRRRASRLAASAICFACAIPSAHADTVILDFEVLTLNDAYGHSIGPSYSEDGFTINAVGPLGGSSLGFFGTGHPAYAGSTALAIGSSGSQAVLTADDGSLFNMLSIDLTEFSSRSQNVAVQFEGLFANDSTITSALFTLDGTFGFESFDLTGFTDLQAVRWTQTPDFHQFDNITLSHGPGGTGEEDPRHMPAPGAALLYTLGFGMIGWVRRRAN